MKVLRMNLTALAGKTGILTLPPMNAFFTPFPKVDLDHLNRLLGNAKKVVITTHSRPDGDAAGSSLGLMYFLKMKGFDAKVIFPGPLENYLRWMPGALEQLVASDDPDGAKKLIQDADLVFCLDYGMLSRTGDFLGGLLRECKAPRVLVDHHIWPENAYSVSFHIEKASSTCELIFRLIWDLGDADLMDIPIAECLYTGMITDTGSFRFDVTTAGLHNAAAFLMTKGLNPGPIHNKLFDNYSENRLRFLGYVLAEKMRVMPDLRTAYMTVSQAEMDKFGVTSGDTEGLVNYNLSMGEINLGVMIIERKGKVKLSFRSKGEFPCNILAGHFNGGGHHNASGGQSDENLAATEKKFLEVLQTFRDRLDY